VTGGWRKLHNEELHNLYSSPSIIRERERECVCVCVCVRVRVREIEIFWEYNGCQYLDENLDFKSIIINWVRTKPHK
jgi:hypothetical protein